MSSPDDVTDSRIPPAGKVAESGLSFGFRYQTVAAIYRSPSGSSS